MLKTYQGKAALRRFFDNEARIGLEIATNLNVTNVGCTEKVGILQSVARGDVMMRLKTGGDWYIDCSETTPEGAYIKVKLKSLIKKGEEIKRKEKYNAIMAIKAEDKKINLEIARKNGDTVFRFEVPKFLEAMYAGRSEEVKTSEKWAGLEFYYMPGLLKNEDYKRSLANYRLVDDYGQALFSNGYFNIAWLRTKGGKGEIKVSDDVSMAKVNETMKGCISFLKEYFTDFLQDFSLKGTLTIDL